jgi:integrase
MRDPFPYARPYRDRHGHTRWRFRRQGRDIYLPGSPGDDDFQKAYRNALEGRTRPSKASKSSAPVKTLRACWQVYKASFPEWQRMAASTKRQQSSVAEAFLSEPVAPGSKLKWGDAPVRDLKRRHVRALLTAMSDHPHAGTHRLKVLRKMILAAVDQEWIEHDPTFKISYRPKVGGFRCWTDDELARFEAYWPLRSTPRLVFELALWTGGRKCDIARLAPGNIVGDAIVWQQRKTGKPVHIPIAPRLAAALAHVDMDGPTLALTQYGAPFSVDGLTKRMREWAAAAGVHGVCMHGLRKTLGTRLAEAGGTSRQAMAVLGHSSLAQVELYARGADQERLARDAMAKVVELDAERRRRAG